MEKKIEKQRNIYTGYSVSTTSHISRGLVGPERKYKNI